MPKMLVLKLDFRGRRMRLGLKEEKQHLLTISFIIQVAQPSLYLHISNRPPYGKILKNTMLWEKVTTQLWSQASLWIEIKFLESLETWNSFLNINKGWKLMLREPTTCIRNNNIMNTGRGGSKRKKIGIECHVISDTRSKNQSIRRDSTRCSKWSGASLLAIHCPRTILEVLLRESSRVHKRSKSLWQSNDAVSAVGKRWTWRYQKGNNVDVQLVNGSMYCRQSTIV